MVMQEKDPFVAYNYVMNSHPRGASVTTPITNRCNRPHKAVTIDMYTNCMLCTCDGWLPKPVGKITDFADLEEIWNNPIAREIQNNVDDQKFTWCAVEHCGIKNSNNIEHSYQLIFGIDDSCNLSCPSCRREPRMHISDNLYEQKVQAVRHTVDMLNKFSSRIHVVFACSGDPLASHIYRPVLQSYKGTDLQSFTLFTNGLLIKKQLPKTRLLDRIHSFRISVDAGSQLVYEKVRLGGNWQVLLENFDYLKSTGLNQMVTLFYVIQKNNFRDIGNFCDLLEQYNFRGNLMQLDDWGTWNRDKVMNPDSWTITNGTYMEHNVLDPSHELHDECRQIVRTYQHRPYLSMMPRVKSLLDLS